MRDSGVPAVEMAFMMPVVKNEWDIYKTNRTRRSSECSNPQACRSRKVSAFCDDRGEEGQEARFARELPQAELLWGAF